MRPWITAVGLVLGLGLVGGAQGGQGGGEDGGDHVQHVFHHDETQHNQSQQFKDQEWRQGKLLQATE